MGVEMDRRRYIIWKAVFYFCTLLFPLMMILAEYSIFYDVVKIDATATNWAWRFPGRVPGQISDNAGKIYVVWTESGHTYKAEVTESGFIDQESSKQVTKLYGIRGMTSGHYYSAQLDPPHKDRLAVLACSPILLVYFATYLFSIFQVGRGIYLWAKHKESPNVG